MLHINITTTQKPYCFQANQAGAYPVQQDSEKSTIVGVSASDYPSMVENTALDTPEQRNTLLAKNITHHRKTLKTMLSEVPLSTLWLLNNYGQACHSDSDAHGDSNDINFDEQFTILVDYYQNAALSAQTHGLGSTTHVHLKQRLSRAFDNLTLSAEQIKNLAATVTHAYALQAAQNPRPTQADLSIRQALSKRMQKLAGTNRDKRTQELHNLGLWQPGNAALTAFLLPPDNQLHTSLRHLVRTEELWLGARQRLAEANARLVLYVANQYKGGFLDFNDLVQEGQSGLLKAVDRFDHQRGFKFSTYAVYWIRQGISRALTRSERVVRLPFGQMANIGKVHRAKEAHFAKTGQEMPIKALAEQTQLSEADINSILMIGQTATSLDTPVGDDDNTTLADFMEQQVYETPLSKIAAQELTDLIGLALEGLSEKEAQVICCRFGVHCHAEMTLEQIGQELGLTRERVRQIQALALQKIKQQFGADLVDFL